MLDIKRVLMSAKSHKRGDVCPLETPWGATLDPGRVLPEYPRPTMVRPAYTMLNGYWEFAIRPIPEEYRHAQALSTGRVLNMLAAAPEPERYDGRILVPFSPETPASGVGRVLQPDELLWYTRTVDIPDLDELDRLIVHLGAVDWACSLMVDGKPAATHVGGYLPFDVDITDFARGRRSLRLALCVYDPSDAGVQPRGKQRLDAGGIWYTPQSGIWQSAWYEVVPAVHVESLALNGAADGTLRIEGALADPRGLLREGDSIDVVVRDHEGRDVATTRLPIAGRRVRGAIDVAHPRLWSPDDPYLYDADVAVCARGLSGRQDALSSYCAFRTAEVKRDESGVARFFLNGSPVFIKGVLDQGYWPEGLMTAPSDEALVHDILAMKQAGFNMLRKHIKIECARWYYHCDRLGMLVWQDAVSGGGAYSPWHTSRKPTLVKASWDRFRDDTPRHRAALSSGSADYRREWLETTRDMVLQLAGHPSIVTWVLFNEGWGQFDAREMSERIHELDPTRPIDATSGWYDQRCGDYLSQHNYFRPLTVDCDRRVPIGYAQERGNRAFVISEFGGWTQAIPGHTVSPYSYGYGNFPTLDAWRDAVRHTLDEAASLEALGLAGYVYTQLSDVEEELNGLLTYDRRVNKLA